MQDEANGGGLVFDPATGERVAANVRHYREAAGLSQLELAQRMAGFGFGFTRETVAKLEAGERPASFAEVLALAEVLGHLDVRCLTDAAEAAWHAIRLKRARRDAHQAYTALKEAAVGYFDAQVRLQYTAQLARDLGFDVGDDFTVWLTTLAEEAVIEARSEAVVREREEENLSEDVELVLQALRKSGYEPYVLHRPEVAHPGDDLNPGDAG